MQLHRPAEAAEDADSVVRAGWAACHLARSAAAQAFSCHGRAASAQVTHTTHFYSVVVFISVKIEEHYALHILTKNKFALLLGEAQLCLPYVC